MECGGGIDLGSLTVFAAGEGVGGIRHRRATPAVELCNRQPPRDARGQQMDASVEEREVRVVAGDGRPEMRERFLEILSEWQVRTPKSGHGLSLLSAGIRQRRSSVSISAT